MLGQKGLTLIEILLSVTIITVLVGLSLPIYVSFANRNDLDIATQDIVSLLRRGQVYARSGNGNNQWGVRFQTNSAILFKGNDFASRDISYDEEVSLAGPTIASGISEVVFAQLTGAPSASGNVNLTGANNESKTVTINAKGMVSF
jgi:prepilin-type N-terminal cleavage/methylation domain-containing protein